MVLGYIRELRIYYDEAGFHPLEVHSVSATLYGARALGADTGIHLVPLKRVSWPILVKVEGKSCRANCKYFKELVRIKLNEQTKSSGELAE
jgi:hypothetical protein